MITPFDVAILWIAAIAWTCVIIVAVILTILGRKR